MAIMSIIAIPTWRWLIIYYKNGGSSKTSGNALARGYINPSSAVCTSAIPAAASHKPIWTVHSFIKSISLVMKFTIAIQILATLAFISTSVLAAPVEVAVVPRICTPRMCP